MNTAEINVFFAPSESSREPRQTHLEATGVTTVASEGAFKFIDLGYLLFGKHAEGNERSDYSGVRGSHPFPFLFATAQKRVCS